MSKHATIIGLRELGQLEPVPHPLVWWMTSKALGLLQNAYGGVRVEIEGFPDLAEPVLFAMNHSHYYDFMQSRRALWLQRRMQTVTFVKPRAFQHRLEGAYMKRMGNIPLVSRGYLISADFAGLHGRRPSEDEYRRLREHVDRGAQLPDAPLFRALQSSARDMLDLPYEPDDTRYDVAIKQRYRAAMATTVELARSVLAAGVSLHVYPQGLYSTRLTRGRIGTVQLARALDVPIVPVGFSGMNECFGHRQMLAHTRGTLTMRFGEPRRVSAPELAEFTPFDPDEELRLRGPLERETQALMNDINALLDPAYTWGEDPDEGDGLEGIARFFD
jgi:1-acyl-sn-glycerol-3-phosphate acyltransferase